MSQPLLAVQGLDAGYGRLQVLHEVELYISQGETVAIIGPNGAGKSTLLKAIYSQVDVYGGRISFSDEEITEEPAAGLLARGLAYVPQGEVVFPSLSVRENLLVAARTLGRHIDDDKIGDILDHFPELKGRLQLPAGQLSGGQQQMVAIGRALLLEPTLLLMDEPSLGLAPVLVDEVFATIKNLQRSGTSILLVEQNARQALAACDRGYVLDLGKNRYQGEGDRLLHDPKVRELYLGG